MSDHRKKARRKERLGRPGRQEGKAEQKLSKRLMRADVRRIAELQKQHVDHGHAEERLRRAEARRIGEGRKTHARGVLPSERLRDSDKKYRTLLEQIPVITYTAAFDETATPLYTSPQIKKVLGFTPAECQADPHLWIDRLHADDRDRVLAELAQCRKLNKPFVSDYRTVARDGRVVWLHDSGAIVRDDQGNPLYMHGVMLDITERKAAEEALRVAEAKYRNLVENLPGVTYTATLDSTSKTLYASPQVTSLLGYAPEEFVKDPGLWCKLLHSEDRQRVASEIQKARKSGEPISLEYRFRTRDGRVMWVRDEAAVVKDATGQPGMLQGVMLDITQRKIAEEELLKTEAKYRSLVESLPGVTYVETLGGDSHVTYVSPQVHPILGYTQEEFLAHPAVWPAIIHPDDFSRVDAEMREFREKKRRHITLEYRALHKDGRVIWIRDEDVVVSDASGESYFLQGVLTDITAHKQSEAQVAYQAYLLSSVRDPVTAVDENFVLTFWNPAAEALYGMKAEEVLGRPVAEVLPTEYPGATREEMRQELRQTGKYRGEVTRHHRDGRTLFIDLAIMALRDGSGRITGFVSVSRDVTERKRAEAQIAYQANLLAQVKDPVFGLDRDWRIVFWNKAAEEAYGWKAEEAMGHVLGDLVRIEYVGITREQFGETLRKNGTCRAEVIRHCKDGRHVHVDLTVTALKDSTGAITGFVSVDRDVTERRRAEARIVYQANLLARVKDPVFAMDRDWRLTFWNAAAEEAYGWKAEEALGQLLRDLTKVEYLDVRMTPEKLNKTLREKGMYRGEAIRHCKDGSARHVDLTITVLRDEAGQINGYISADRDITERKLAEAALRDSEERYRKLFEGVPVGLFRNAPDGGFLDANPALAQMFGHPDVASLLTANARDFYVTPDDRPEWLATVNALGEIHGAEVQRQRRDGRLIWCRNSIRAVKGPDGQVQCYEGSMEDITERKLAEEALRRSEEKYRLLVEGQTHLVVKVDTEWKFEFVSPPYCEMFGKTEEELLGHHFMPLVHEDDRELTARAMENLYKPPYTCYVEQRAMTKHGWRWMAWADKAVLDENGKVTAIIGVGRDITERKLAEEALRESEARYRALVESQVELVCRWLPDSTLTFVNEAYCKFHGKTREELLGMKWTIPPSGTTEPEAEWQCEAVLKEKRLVTYEREIADCEGRKRWHQWIDSPIFDEKGNLVEIQSVGRDITDRVRAEAEVIRARDFYLTLFEGFPTLVWRSDQEGRFDYANRTWQEFTGCAHQSLGASALEKGQGDPWAEAIHPEDRDQCQEAWLEAFRARRPFEREYRIRRHDGQYRWFYDVGRPFNDLDGNFAGYIGTAVDVTERRRAERLLHKREEVLEAISYTAEQFLKAADWEDCIDSVLARLGPVSRSDGVCLLPVHLGADGSYVATLTHEWCAPNIKPLSGAPELELFHLRRYGLEDQEQALLAGRYVCTQVRNMPPAAQKLLGKYDVKSVALLPVFVDQKLWGAFIFNDRAKEHMWSAAEFGSVGAAASALGTAIEKQQVQALVRIKESAIASSINGIAMFDLRGELTYANSAFVSMWGCGSEGEILAKPFAEFLQNSEKAAQVWRSLRETGAWIGELEARREGGTTFDVQLAATRVTDAEGRPVTMIGSFIDISERAVAERELSALLRLQQSTLATIPSSLLILDADLNVIMANSRYLESQGMQPSDAVNKNITDIFPLALLSEQSLLERIQAVALSGGRDELTSVRYAVENHPDRFLDIHICGIKPVHGEGERPRVLLVLDDVTQQCALEEQVRQAVKMESVGKLAGGMAHDFNNLLTGISGFTDLVLEDMAADSPLRADLMQVRQLSDRAASLTRGLLAFSRRQTLRPVVLNINALTDNTSKMLKRLIGEDVDLSFVPAPDLGSVKADPSQIEQVLVNLAVNARDAMPNGGKMIVETANVALGEDYTQTHPEVKPGKYVMLSVADTGSGMDRETLSHLFEPFFTTKAPGKGTGLGLATAYGIIKQHEGSMSVYSEPGRGTTFRIYLPRVAAPAEELTPAYPTREAEPPGAGTILVVEDEAAVRTLVKRVLEKQGYTVLTVAEGDEAERIIDERGKEIQLLLTDVVLPGRSGPELYQRLSAKQPSLRVLFMSGYTDRTVSQNGIFHAATSFISKPFSGDQLARKVRQVLA